MNTMTNNLTGQEWLNRYGVSFDWSSHGFQIEDGWEHQVYRITLEHDGRKLELPYLAGLLAVESMPDGPTPDDVLWMHAGDIQNVESWQEWAKENGYEDPMEAPVRAYNTWEACAKMRREIYDFCDSQAMFEDFESIEEAE